MNMKTIYTFQCTECTKCAFIKVSCNPNDADVLPNNSRCFYGPGKGYAASWELVDKEEIEESED